MYSEKLNYKKGPSRFMIVANLLMMGCAALSGAVLLFSAKDGDTKGGHKDESSTNERGGYYKTPTHKAGTADAPDLMTSQTIPEGSAKETVEAAYLIIQNLLPRRIIREADGTAMGEEKLMRHLREYITSTTASVKSSRKTIELNTAAAHRRNNFSECLRDMEEIQAGMVEISMSSQKGQENGEIAVKIPLHPSELKKRKMACYFVSYDDLVELGNTVACIDLQQPDDFSQIMARKIEIPLSDNWRQSCCLVSKKIWELLESEKCPKIKGNFIHANLIVMEGALIEMTEKQCFDVNSSLIFVRNVKNTLKNTIESHPNRATLTCKLQKEQGEYGRINFTYIMTKRFYSLLVDLERLKDIIEQSEDQSIKELSQQLDWSAKIGLMMSYIEAYVGSYESLKSCMREAAFLHMSIKTLFGLLNQGQEIIIGTKDPKCLTEQLQFTGTYYSRAAKTRS